MKGNAPKPYYLLQHAHGWFEWILYPYRDRYSERLVSNSIGQKSRLIQPNPEIRFLSTKLEVSNP
jgi:hypothetical protein